MIVRDFISILCIAGVSAFGNLRFLDLSNVLNINFHMFRDETQKAFGGVLRFYFFLRKLHHCFWRSKHDLRTTDFASKVIYISTQDKVAKVNTIRHCCPRYDVKSSKMACNWLMMRSSAEVWVIWPSRSSRRSASGHRQDQKINRVPSMNRPAYGCAVK